MEILRKNVHMSCRKDQAVSQITLDSDFNVPDVKPDIDKLILDQGEIQMDDVRPEKDRIHLKGVLVTSLLYASDQPAVHAQSMECRIPFEEVVHMEGMEIGDHLKIDWDIEDLNVSLIHSRKLSVRSIVTFTVLAEEIRDVELACGLSQGENVQMLIKEQQILCLAMRRKDTFRVREELLLAGNQANIKTLLWKDISMHGTQIRLQEGKAAIKGELSVFALYEGENEEQLQWAANTLPFSGMLELGGCRPEMISDIQIHMAQKNMEVKPDYDGEERMFQVDVLLELDIRLYEEEKINILMDAYSLSGEMVLNREEVTLDHLLVKNNSRARYNQRLTVKREDFPVLQICHTSGNVVIEEVRRSPEGLTVEGILFVQILYITADDKMPVCRSKGGIPFMHTIEAAGMDETCKYSMKGELEQLSAAMMDSQDAEIRAAISFHLIANRPVPCENICSIQMKPLDYEKLHAMPGIVGCTAGEQDSLWEIAKKYYTTTEQIQKTNGRTSESIKQGEKLLVIKSIGDISAEN